MNEAVQTFATEIVDGVFSIRPLFVLKPRGHHRASQHDLPDLAETFVSLSRKARCDIVADGYNVRTVDVLGATKISPEVLKSSLKTPGIAFQKESFDAVVHKMGLH
ncbi:hypothetical protein P3339_12705 [Microbulbifer sp. MLAF003]|uniref:hypothetical protein n=1 Tax=unclassified Microbulbifer TaxID=2619833 RepID=UPI0024AC8DD9|nr:hypothetical protein [Microbulbifer sp. MLAF003]WHI49343.1 hypothetical protein P3339_12705 [Microbulbifer sp. MLAF003]